MAHQPYTNGTHSGGVNGQAKQKKRSTETAIPGLGRPGPSGGAAATHCLACDSLAVDQVPLPAW